MDARYMAGQRALLFQPLVIPTSFFDKFFLNIFKIYFEIITKNTMKTHFCSVVNYI